MARLGDPLEAYNGLSIFRRTFGGSLPPNPTVNDDDELLSAHNFLKDLPVKNSDKLLKQGKSILDASSEPVNAEMLNEVVDEVVEKTMESPRARRPGLGRKRPRFSILPDSSQLTVNLEPNLDIDKLQDPVEFFTAFERQQDARKEIEKQTGHVSTDSNQCITSMAPRPRRPGIPGRSRTVKYQHLYPLTFSQETFEEDILSPSNHDSQQETDNVDGASQLRESTNVPSEESELAGTMAKTEKRVEKLLDELLAYDYEELDGDRAVTLLQDRLQIKSLDIEKLNLPELQDLRRTDMKSLGGNVSKPRTVLSDIHNLLKRNRTPMKQQNAEKTAPSFGSPTPPKSPLSSLSLMLKHRLQSNPATDPYSAVDIDHSPATNAPSFENVNRSSDVVDMEKDFSISGKLKSLMIETEDKMAGDISPPKVAVGDSESPSNKHVNDNLTSLGSGSDIRPSKYSSLVEDDSVGGDNWVIDDNLSQPGVNVDSQTDGPNEMEDMVEDIQQKAVASAQTGGTVVETSNDIHNQFEQSSSTVAEDHTMDVCLKTHDNAPEQRQDTASEHHNERVEEPPVISMNRQTKAKSRSRKESKKSLSRRQSLAEQSSPAVAEDHTMDGSLETHDSAPEERQDTAPDQHDESFEEPPVISTNKRTKAKSRPSKEGKRSLSRRQSLAASGTSWETGVRRSTRIRSRPLEYWKGERFLYGRIHGSLATVIGIKYESPGKDTGRPTIKVKSFVSDEYKDLVDLAALH